jgi:prepilin-type N-terminal cleavage/methylation domain-containing protein
MESKKGFTLIELLAVIVILAIILVIAVPQVMKVIAQSKTDSYRASANMILKAIETEYVTQVMSGTVTLNVAGASTSCPAGISNWNTANGTCNYQLTITGGDIASLSVTLGAGAGKFAGVATVTVTR